MTPTSPREMGEVWQRYQRQGVIEARAWTQDDADSYFALSRSFPRTVSVSAADELTALKEPPVGYVARNPDNHADQWYIAPDYFAKHYAVAAPTPSPPSDADGVGEVKRYVYTDADGYSGLLYLDSDPKIAGPELNGYYVTARDYDHLLSAVARLREERDQYKAVAYNDTQTKLIDALDAELARTQQELRKAEAARDAALADARRYRWLRDETNPEASNIVGTFGGDELDAAIDSAMAALSALAEGGGA